MSCSKSTMGLSFGHPSDPHRAIVPPTYDITLKGTFSWKLVFEDENDQADNVVRTFARTRTTTLKPHIFSMALNNATLAYVRSVNNADVDHRDVFFKAISAMILDKDEDAREIDAVLKKTRDGLGVEFTSTETDTRTCECS